MVVVVGGGGSWGSGPSSFGGSLKFMNTVNVETFAQYIFSRISRRALDARKYDVSENINHYKLNGIKY